MNGLNGQAIRVPRWAITAVLVVGVLLAAGFRLGVSYNEMQDALEDVGVRLCRLERAHQLSPWPSCLEPRQTGAGK